VRGVLKLTTSLAPVERDILAARQQSLLVLGAALMGTLMLTGYMLGRSIVRPIEKVTSAMVRASAGDLEQKVPVQGGDELAQMAGSFNTMTDELQKTYEGLQHEQDKLTTIIHSAREAIIVTDPGGRIVLVNPAAAELLDKPIARIIEDGFLGIVDDPDTVTGWLDRQDSAIAKVFAYKQRIFNVYAARIHNDKGEMVGSAALLRDITEEKRLEEELRRLSTTDGLTGLYNRRFLDDTLQKELSRAHRYPAPLSVLMFDVDHFKKFNDTHGHDQGDRVLQAVAKTLRGALRNQDYPCRYGGEEFVAILPNTPKTGAYSVAERLRTDIETMVVDGLKVTISIGVAEYPDFEVRDQARLIEAADGALYHAKQEGRNRTCVAEPRAPETPG
jgi:diguanylate cyclase (GGDEF)-like protein